MFACIHGCLWPSLLGAAECDCMDPDEAAVHLV